MPKVICTRPNASTSINGVKFTVLEDLTGVISEEISEEAAAQCLAIPGYHLEGDEPSSHEQEAPQGEDTTKAEANVKAPAAPKLKKGKEPKETAAAPVAATQEAEGASKAGSDAGDDNVF